MKHSKGEIKPILAASYEDRLVRLMFLSGTRLMAQVRHVGLQSEDSDGTYLGSFFAELSVGASQDEARPFLDATVGLPVFHLEFRQLGVVIKDGKALLSGLPTLG
jgi:hypothetical protein